MTAISSVCVYCGSSGRGPAAHREAASRLGEILAEQRIRLVFGGGRVGLMGVVADAALAAGGHVTGIIPTHLVRDEVGHAKVTELIEVPTMHERKQRMFDLSDAFIVLPGGLGTLDELFEIITWKQLRLHDKPVAIANLDRYWDPLVALIDAMIDGLYAPPKARDFFRVVYRIEDILPTLRAAAPPRIKPHPERL